MRIDCGHCTWKALACSAWRSYQADPERVKEALFSVIQFEIEGRRILDLFAGSGQLGGWEALSRGAREAVFVDAGKEAAALIEKISRLAVYGVRKGHADGLHGFFLHRQKPFDLAFLDPPYQKRPAVGRFGKTTGVMQPGGTVVCEHPADMLPPESRGTFQRVKTYRYGKVALSFYRHKEWG